MGKHSQGKLRKKIEKTAFIIGMVAVITVGIVFGNSVYRSLHKEKAATVTPIGDISSDIYTWEGNYVDSAGLMTTMSIVKHTGGYYDISISLGTEGSSDVTFWTLTATYNTDYRALEYVDAVRTDWVIPTSVQQGDDVNIATEEIYSGGKGYLYLADDRVYWHDNNEDMGNGMQFEKTE